MSRVAILGAGLTGLATAHALRDRADVVVFEADAWAGGQVRTRRLAGADVDVGADAFLARQPEADALARDLELGDQLVEPAAGQVWLWVAGRRRPLPAGVVLGVPTSVRALLRSRVLPPGALARAAIEPLLPGRPPTSDVSVAELLGARFGRGVVDHLVDPLLGGVYAGDPARLSAEAATPLVWAASRRGGSLARSLMDVRRAPPAPPGPVFRTVAGGLGRLIDRLAGELGGSLRTDAAVHGITRAAGGWFLSCGDEAAQQPFDVVVVTVPSRPAAQILRDVAPDASRGLAGLRSASVGVVSLAYPWSATGNAMTGSGVLVPRRERRLVKAVTVSSRKWPHLAGADRFLLRASVGRVDDEAWRGLDDDELTARVDDEVRELVGLDGPSDASLVTRWDDALPQYEVGHLGVTRAIRAGLPDGVLIGGAAFGGVGLPSRVRDASQLADQVLARSAR